MDFGIALDGAGGLLLVSLPWLLLVWAAQRRARKAEATPVQSTDDRAPLPAEPLGVMTASHSHQTDASSFEGDVAEALNAVPDDAPPPLSLEEQEAALVLAVETAKADRDDPILSRSSVALARLLIARSQRPQASSLLLSAVLAAQRAKLPVVHAEARIELAEIALLDGDLTTACEHWQMAKLMFHDTGRRFDQDRMADLMRRHRCPTDWVLTNF
jgi:hypothetical protein